MCGFICIVIEASQPAHQPASQPACQPTSQPANQPTSQPADRPAQPPPTSHPASQPQGGGGFLTDRNGKKKWGLPWDPEMLQKTRVFM